jgi:hypothetical protein
LIEELKIISQTYYEHLSGEFHRLGSGRRDPLVHSTECGGNAEDSDTAGHLGPTRNVDKKKRRMARCGGGFKRF